MLDFIEKDDFGNFRLKDKVDFKNLKKVKLEGKPIFVFNSELEEPSKTIIFFIHGNKKGKKVYKVNKSRLQLPLIKIPIKKDSIGERLNLNTLKKLQEINLNLKSRTCLT